MILEKVVSKDQSKNSMNKLLKFISEFINFNFLK